MPHLSLTLGCDFWLYRHLKQDLAGAGAPQAVLLAPLRMFEQFQSVPKKNRLEQSAGAFCKQGGIKSPFPPHPHPLIL